MPDRVLSFTERRVAMPIEFNTAARRCIGLMVALCLAWGGAAPAWAQFDPRPRLLVSTDIGGDPDDQQSLVRLLAHNDAFRIEGLIASAAGTPGEVASNPRPDLIRQQIDAYELHHDNLVVHSPLFASAADLRAKVFAGSSARGFDALIPGRSTDASNAIIAAVDASNEPLNVAIWGGATELAQALVDVQATRTASQTLAFANKLRVHAINDQDGYDDAAQGTLARIKQAFPSMLIIDPTPRGAASDDIFQRFNSTYRGFYQNDSTNGNDTPIPLVTEQVAALNGQAWLDENVNTGHGALGALYPSTAQNPTTDRNTVGVKEGDTPSWMYFLQTGLGDPSQPTQGGWGGRYEPAADGTNHFVVGYDALPDVTITDDAARGKWTVARYREAYQNEFANRMDWFVAEAFGDANHAPTPFSGTPPLPKSQRIATDGSVFLFSDGWFDPDGDTLAYSWWFYEEAGVGSLPAAALASLDAASFDFISLDLAGVDSGSELHLILEITDASADVPFTRYERFIVQVGSRVIPEPATGAMLLAGGLLGRSSRGRRRG